MSQEISRASFTGGLLHIKSLGFAPKTVIDVGAALGTFALYETFPDARHILIEPIAENEPYLAKICKKLGNADYLIAAASAASGECTLEVNDNLVHSTLAEAESPTPPAVTLRTIPTLTLDQLCQQKALEPPYLIKVDVDGRELDVLQGATQAIAQAEYVLIEATLFHQIHDVIDWMRSHGFVIYDLLDLSWRPFDRALYQCDIAFVKADSPYRADKTYLGQQTSPADEARLRSHLQAYREQLIDYVETYYSDEAQTVGQRLRGINLIAFPDWALPDEHLLENLAAYIRPVITHPQAAQMSVLIATDPVSLETADLALSAVMMQLVQVEALELADGEPDIVLVTPSEWQTLVPRLSARLCLPHESATTIAQLDAATLPTCTTDDIQRSRVVVRPDGYWELQFPVGL